MQLDERHAGEEGVIRSDIAEMIDRASAMSVYAYNAITTATHKSAVAFPDGLAERLAGAARSDPEALPPPSDCPQASPVRVGRRQRLEPVCHEFTHRRVTYAAFLFEVSEMEWLPDLPGQHRWVSRARARELPMGVAQIRLLRQLL